MPRKGLGKGLDSLIPDFYNEDFDSNSPQSLEDILKEDEGVEEVVEDIESIEEKPDNAEESKDDKEEDVSTPENEESEKDEGNKKVDGSSEDLSGDKGDKDTLQTSQEKIQVQEAHVEEVKEIVGKNPRITLWSSRSSAVFRYLRKTEPEFSISKEASVLIEEAVAKKYPEIWALFEDL